MCWWSFVVFMKNDPVGRDAMTPDRKNVPGGSTKGI